MMVHSFVDGCSPVCLCLTLLGYFSEFVKFTFIAAALFSTTVHWCVMYQWYLILFCACVTVDEIYHLAAPASPFHYLHNPIKTIKTNTVGTAHLLGMNYTIISVLCVGIYGNVVVADKKTDLWKCRVKAVKRDAFISCGWKWMALHGKDDKLKCSRLWYVWS